MAWSGLFFFPYTLLVVSVSVVVERPRRTERRKERRKKKRKGRKIWLLVIMIFLSDEKIFFLTP